MAERENRLKTNKKDFLKNIKKGIDNLGLRWYTIQAVAERRHEPVLEKRTTREKKHLLE